VTRQPTIHGIRRKPMSTSAHPDVERAIGKEMARYDCSRSFVLITCAAFALNVKEQPDYRTTNGHRKRRATR
jgi:hypothetical protein